jgi:hypothetical protein
MQVRAQQREHRPVALGEVWAGPAGQGQAHIPAGLSGPRWRFGQVQHERVLEPQWPVVIGVHTCAVPLPGRVEVRDLYDAVLSVLAGSVYTVLAIPVIFPEHLIEGRVVDARRDLLAEPVPLPIDVPPV